MGQWPRIFGLGAGETSCFCDSKSKLLWQVQEIDVQISWQAQRVGHGGGLKRKRDPDVHSLPPSFQKTAYLIAQHMVTSEPSDLRT